jgi:PhoH-like ATPase
MYKTYVFDTSALICDPFAWRKYPNSVCILPIEVLNELDNLKKQSSEAGKNARVCIRAIDEISALGDIGTGVLLHDDVMLKVDASYYDLTNPAYHGFGDPTYGDTKILACTYTHWLENNDTTLVSQDLNLRIKAKGRGVFAEAHVGNNVASDDLFSGAQVVVDEDAGMALQELSYIDPNQYGLSLQPNECILFENQEGDGIAMGRLVASDKIKLIKKHYPWKISPRNKEQTFALDLIMDRNIDLVTLIGKSGTGKSLMVLAAALELVLQKKEYDKFIIYRPIQSVGAEIGFLPGLKEEKLAPWFQAIMDGFEFLFNAKGGAGDWKKNLEMYVAKGKIEMEAITYIRGRSIPNAIILIDECQNLSPSEVKTVLTRAGEGTKIILTGDIEQIDNKSLDATSNGLSYVIEKFKDSLISGHITFLQGERSRLASTAADIL